MQLTILDKSTSYLVLFFHESQIESSTITNLVINVIKTPREEDWDTGFDFRIFLANTKLGKSRHSRSSDNGILQDNSVVDITNIFGRMRSLWSLNTKEMQYSNRKLGELAIFDKLAEVCKS